MTYFDGTMGTGGEGQQFFLLSISKNILHLMIQMIYFDGTAPWERHRGNSTVGWQQFFYYQYDSNDLF